MKNKILSVVLIFIAFLGGAIGSQFIAKTPAPAIKNESVSVNGKLLVEIEVEFDGFYNEEYVFEAKEQVLKNIKTQYPLDANVNLIIIGKSAKLVF